VEDGIIRCKCELMRVCYKFWVLVGRVNDWADWESVGKRAGGSVYVGKYICVCCAHQNSDKSVSVHSSLYLQCAEHSPLLVIAYMYRYYMRQITRTQNVHKD
jgi:hypothetical protein